MDADAASIRARKRTRRALCGASIRSCERTGRERVSLSHGTWVCSI